ncbi:MAG: hypothetical protein CMJ78_15185 [Planctomycetaceae bacterium]|nr:hypothetical protein [Planctomycetaceae bacterium]
MSGKQLSSAPSHPPSCDTSLSSTSPTASQSARNSTNFDSSLSEYRLGIRGRVFLTVWCLFLVAGFGLAYHLEPDTRGFGTHQQLGLPQCGVRDLFGIPCPSCGMTTSFSYFIRGQWIQSAKSNVAGMLLALICALQIPWSCFSIYRGRMWRVSAPDVCLLWIILVVGGVSIVNWVTRL